MADYVEDLHEPLNIDDPKTWVINVMIQIAQDEGFSVTKNKGFFATVLGVIGLGSEHIELHKIEDASYKRDDQELGVEYYYDPYPFSMRDTVNKVIKKYHEASQEFTKYNHKSNIERIVFDVYNNFSTYVQYKENVESRSKSKIYNVLDMSYEDILTK